MLRLFSILALAAAGTATALGSECPVTVRARWEEAMRKVMEITHRRGNLDTDLKAVCALWRDAAEIVEAADEYYPACDPFGAQNARIAKLDIEAAFEGFDSTQCTRRRSASKRR